MASQESPEGNSLEIDRYPTARDHTFGTVRHRDPETHEIILVPTPSNDPNDPLNWSQAFKYYMVAVICLSMFMCNFVSAGPVVAIAETAMTFFPDWKKQGLVKVISKVAYCYTVAAMMQGMGNLFWMPMVSKFGRRPVYVMSFSIYFLVTIWAAWSPSYGSFLGARTVLGFASGAAETLAPLTITDVFFLHERGAIMGIYTAALSCGVAGGIIIDGLITIHHTWRYIYYVAVAAVGANLCFLIFTFPETHYTRVVVDNSIPGTPTMDEEKGVTTTRHRENTRPIPAKKTYFQRLSIFSGVHTEESFGRLVARPLALILLPPVLWGALVMSGTIGFLVAVTSNVSSAYKTAYGFKTYQTGLCFFGAIIGSLIGIPVGGHLGDWVADYLSKRNKGIREPEMRLPAITISVITAPLALVLFGVGVQHRLHWMVPTLGLSLLNFSITQATNISLTYTIDSYRPIAGEITLTSMAFKSAIGFLLSFYTNPWIAEVGYASAYGTMGAISGVILLGWIPFYIWGKRIRHATWKWKVAQYAHWDMDREVGE